MKKLIFILAISMCSGCGVDYQNRYSPDQTDPDPVFNQEHTPLELVFVSAHLGSYTGCPEEAYDGGPYHTGGEGACIDAVVAFEVVNLDFNPIRGINVSAVQLLDSNDVSADLPVIALLDVNHDYESFDGTLEGGESTLLVVEFRGLFWQDELFEPRLRLFIEVEGQDDVEWLTPIVVEPITDMAT